MLTPVQRAGPAGRYAPSPTGPLHLGNIYAALAAHNDIRQQGGTIILRIEDVDLPRNVHGAEASIIEDLRWMGLSWDEGPEEGGPAGPYRQSERNQIYREALLALAQQGLVYPCTCSRRDLQSDASAPHGPDGPIYPGHCRRTVSAAEAEELVSTLMDAQPGDCGMSLRLRTDRIGTVAFDDELHGTHKVDYATETGDFVILRRDRLWAYQFACAVDDALMGITRVVRGRDLLPSTPRQVAIISALGYPVPVYRHIPLLLGPDGERLSKRIGSITLQQLRQKGLAPADVRREIDGWCKK